jgi:hypothetical protein
MNDTLEPEKTVAELVSCIRDVLLVGVAESTKIINQE